MSANVDQNVVEGFGDEWSRFDQSALDSSELAEMFDNYVSIFSGDRLTADPLVLTSAACSFWAGIVH